MESRCKKSGEPLAAAAATELAPTRDARSSGHNDAQPSASNFGPAVAGPGTPPFSAEHFEKHRVARVTREQKHHNWALKFLREEYAGSEQQFPATETMWCPEVFHPHKGDKTPTAPPYSISTNRSHSRGTGKISWLRCAKKTLYACAMATWESPVADKALD